MAIIAAIASLAAAVVAGVFALVGAAKQRKHDTEIAGINARFDQTKLQQESDLRVREEQLKQRNAELAAKRRLLEAVRHEAGGADQRIRWIAARARDGTITGLLGNNRPDWKRTIYALMAPVVLADLVGSVEADDDPLTTAQYALARCLRALLSADEELAAAANLEYQPGKLILSKAPKTKDSFRIYDPQGVELLNELIDLFREPKNDPSIVGAEDFVKRFSTDPQFDGGIQSIGAILREFQPREKPVFWTILIAYAYIAHALEAAAAIADLRSWITTYELERREYDPSDGAPAGIDLFAVPSNASRAWLGRRLA